MDTALAEASTTLDESNAAIALSEVKLQGSEATL